MNDNKNIDRLFQEKFKDFEAQPSPELWQRIESGLNAPKKKRRVVALWWKLGGVAAIFILMFGITNVILFNKQPLNTINNTTIVNTKKLTNPNSKIDNNKPVNNNTEAEITLAKQQEDHKQRQTAKTKNSLPNNNTKLRKTTTVLQNTRSNPIVKNNTPKISNSSDEPQNNDVNSINKDFDYLDNAISKTKTADLDTKETKLSNSNSGLSENEKDIIKSILDENNTQETSVVNNTEVTENLEDTLDKDFEKNKTTKKWQITPNVAPVFFNAIGSNGSTIGAEFNNNSKTFDNNISYGVNAKYKVAKRLNLRAGVNKVDLSFRTNDVVLFGSQNNNNFITTVVSPNNRRLQNVNLNATFSNSQAINLNNSNSGPSAAIEQEFGFIEVPLEIEYAISDKKLGLRVIGGFSAFFLDNNEVFSRTRTQSTLIGEATNINDISYSANLGLGVNYKVSKTLNFSLEPTFKYQINTFNEVTGNFQPYFVGVYSGVSLQF